MKNLTFTAFLLSITLLFGCAATQQSDSEASADAKKAEEPAITGDFPANSAFAKLKVGMSQGQVHDILGDPTDSKSYTTGKAWIPFYYGNDVSRYEETYKGIGVITYTGAGIGGVNWKLYRAKYDPSEDGYVN